ncbi:MAG: M48 family metallopeptidase [Luminiphilus sp.]|nr:M48 family metallopeptidase [Luminiphilus sp.]
MAFDVEAATAAYIDGLGEEALAQAAAYTTGNQWLMLWGLLVSAIITFIIIRTGILAKTADKLSNRGFVVRVFSISAVFLVVSSLLEMPWSIFSGWWRESQYGRTSQPLMDFLGQGLLALAISVLLVGIFFVAIYAFIQKTKKLWWLWGGAFTGLFTAFLMVVGPTYIAPLFNDYQPVPAGEVRDAVKAMAVEASIPTDRIFMYDGSRQSNNFTANVAGIGGAARIAISDVALDEATLDEVKAVTGHEVGHYVLGHVWDGVLLTIIVVMLSFFIADKAFNRVARLFGAREDIRDPTTLPVLLFLVSVIGMFTQPVSNTLSRMNETEADHYSYEMVNLPDGMASALVKTAEYRNPRPGILEEWLFYTHPSVERRVRAAMEWKASHSES